MMLNNKITHMQTFFSFIILLFHMSGFNELNMRNPDIFTLLKNYKKKTLYIFIIYKKKLHLNLIKKKIYIYIYYTLHE